MSENYNHFAALIKTMLRLDRSDLDFGIYRVMNIRRKSLETFLDVQLPGIVREALEPYVDDRSDVQAQLDQLESTAQLLGKDAADIPEIAEKYAQLEAQLAGGRDLDALEAEVYAALYRFFGRYYDEGDFLPRRRYREGAYAMPYGGEEVKFFWASQDQYYIKSTETFRDYSFRDGEHSIHFQIIDATTEQNNNRESDERARVFMLWEPHGERAGLPALEAEGNRLIVRFVYNIPKDKKIKYPEENLQKISEAILRDFRPWMGFLRDTSADSAKPKSLLQKHLEAFVAKNTFDYFIHKDLRKFLMSELDFYLKNEVIHLDDFDAESLGRMGASLGKVRAIERVGRALVDFLAQLEDFQRRLWRKKKFVVGTDWCITLDRVDESFFPEIIDCKAQLDEWVEIFALDEASGFSRPLTEDFLRDNPGLLLDTRHFSTEFKDRLIAGIARLDDHTDGLMVHSENYQAVRLLGARYRGGVKCIYLDPPYNTTDAGFIYKNKYRHASWASMMQDRVAEAFSMLAEDGVLLVTIDDEELYDLKHILDSVVGASRYIGTIVIQSNPRGRGINSFYATCHEYCLCYAKNPDRTVVVDQTLTDSQEQDYRHAEKGRAYRLLPFRRSGGYSVPEDRPNSEFPLFFDEDGLLFAVGGARAQAPPAPYLPREILLLGKAGALTSLSPEAFEERFPDAIRLMPVDTSGERRVWRWSDREKILLAGARGEFVLKGRPGGYYVQLKDWIKPGRKPKTIWSDSKYDSSSHGTNLLKNIFGDRAVFGYPKSIYSTADALHTVVGLDDEAVVLDFFAGSGTTGHAVQILNARDRARDLGGDRKYILVEMGEYFGAVTKTRMQKILYADEWKRGKPQNRDSGVSHLMKYIRLESYEDALSNVQLAEEEASLFPVLGSDYLIHYMLEIEAMRSLLGLSSFREPFRYKLSITENNEVKERTVDLVETFHYLLGLAVEHRGAPTRYSASPDLNGPYEGAVQIEPAEQGAYIFQRIVGRMPDGTRALIVWRNIPGDLLEANAALDAYFAAYPPEDCKLVFVNGDAALESLRGADGVVELRAIETEFQQRMFEEV